MDSWPRSFARVILALAGGALAGLAAWLIANVLSPDTYALAIPSAPAVAVGLAAGLGSEVGLRTQRTWTTGHLLAWGLALLAAVFLYGAFVIAMVRLRVWQFEGATGATLILAPAIAFAFVAGTVAGRRGWPLAWLDGLGALTLLVAGALAFAVGGGLVFAATYSNYCPLPPYYHSAYDCLDPGCWFELQILTLAALVVGAVLGGALWLALGLGGALRQHRS